MDHAPYQTWIIEGRSLDPEQETELQNHLRICPHCSGKFNALQSIENAFITSGMESPRPGFTARWNSKLASRVAAKHNEMVRRYLVTAGLSILLLIAVMAALLFSGNTLVRLFLISIQSLVSIMIWVSQIKQILFSIAHIMPPGIALLLWEISSGLFCLLAVSWAVTMWRLTLEGIKTR